jgi:hypothetical protein
MELVRPPQLTAILFVGFTVVTMRLLRVLKGLGGHASSPQSHSFPVSVPHS